MAKKTTAKKANPVAADPVPETVTSWSEDQKHPVTGKSLTPNDPEWVPDPSLAGKG